MGNLTHLLNRQYSFQLFIITAAVMLNDRCLLFKPFQLCNYAFHHPKFYRFSKSMSIIKTESS